MFTTITAICWAAKPLNERPLKILSTPSMSRRSKNAYQEIAASQLNDIQTETTFRYWIYENRKGQNQARCVRRLLLFLSMIEAPFWLGYFGWQMLNTQHSAESKQTNAHATNKATAYLCRVFEAPLLFGCFPKQKRTDANVSTIYLCARSSLGQYIERRHFFSQLLLVAFFYILFFLLAR